MKIEDFNKIVEDQLNDCKNVLIKKATEYAEEHDRLSQFKIAAGLTNGNQRTAVAGMMVKHTQSVYELCANEDLDSTEKWDEKITDHINYLLLLKAVVVEETREAQKQKSPSFIETTTGPNNPYA